jgi:23S rRNA (uracil1939-C5)-methyltransferase
MKRGDRIIAEVSLLSAKGDGIADVEGSQMVIPGAVPGDKVEAFVKRKRRGWAEGRVVRLLESQLPRTPASCSHFGTCGGCRWQDIDYESQLRLKSEMVRNALSDVEVGEYREIIGSPEIFYYRNKMEFSFGRGEEDSLHIGLHHLGRYNRIFDLEACYLQSEVSNKIVHLVRQYAMDAGLPPYDLKSHEGILRFLVIREGKETGELMVNLVVSQFHDTPVPELANRLISALPDITTFIVTLHTGKAQVAMGEEQFVLKGTGCITERCGELAFDISPQAFFQTNTRQAAVLYRIVSNLAKVDETMRVLDLYCGTGGISLNLGTSVDSVVGIEQVEESVCDARHNAIKNGLANCTFLVGRTEDVLSELVSEGQIFDLVIADPPRAGMHVRAIEALVDLRPKVILYVSCNPQTLAADAEQLVSCGFNAAIVQPLDLFPHTPHCEIVMVLQRQI